ncbi:hypothetical protein ADUPG1_012809 [Aduncisulcus paluster]|uniref:Uncharacterized protein n=1 Tax=Aduncisulcus paluster TaxID=2918883 RepID=A0ABQ5K0R7_9EUKA|nr:hypothetical protein ADUPG1_012809 [Aduncisulcus paluster]
MPVGLSDRQCDILLAREEKERDISYHAVTNLPRVGSSPVFSSMINEDLRPKQWSSEIATPIHISSSSSPSKIEPQKEEEEKDQETYATKTITNAQYIEKRLLENGGKWITSKHPFFSELLDY